jgi:Zinc finger, C3HC4 type (RING finger)
MQVSSVPLSSTGRWEAKLPEYRKKIDRLRQMPLSRLPYVVLNDVAEAIQQQWQEWQSRAESLTAKKFDNAKEFVNHISERNNSHFMIGDLTELSTASRIDTIRDSIFACRNWENVRQLAEENVSKGYMKDISDETIAQLAQTLAENSNWRLLADGLGYDSPNSFKNCSTMLFDWVSKNPLATVERLHFEAKLLNFQDVCRFLEAIPLQGKTKTRLSRINSEKMLEMPITCFDIKALKKIAAEAGVQIVWYSLLPKLNLYYGKIEAHDVSTLIWESGKTSLKRVLKELQKEEELTSKIEQFIEEINDGMYEPTSGELSGAITATQVAYLCRFIPPATVSSFQDPMDIFSNFFGPQQRGDFSFGGPGPRKPPETEKTEETEETVSHDLARYITECHLNISSLIYDKGDNRIRRLPTLEEAIFLLWQYQSEQSMYCDLQMFCSSILKILQEYPGAKKFKWDEKFKQLCDNIVPKRSFDPNLFMHNQEQKILSNEMEDDPFHAEDSLSKSMEKTKEVAKPLLDRDCIICMEKERNYAPIPCGHLRYCLECIEKANVCGECQETIFDRIRIFL